MRMNKTRRPEKYSKRNETSIKFSTSAKLWQAADKLMAKDVPFRVSGRSIILQKDNIRQQLQQLEEMDENLQQIKQIATKDDMVWLNLR